MLTYFYNFIVAEVIKTPNGGSPTGPIVGAVIAVLVVIVLVVIIYRKRKR